MKPKIIKTEAEYRAALAYLSTLMDAEPGMPEEDDLVLFSILIETYEKEHYPVGLPDPIEAIKYRMEQMGLSRKDIVQYFGSPSKVSEVLNRKRPLSISMIRALEKGLGIPAEVLIQEPGEGSAAQSLVSNEIETSDIPSEKSTSEEVSSMGVTLERLMGAIQQNSHDIAQLTHSLAILVQHNNQNNHEGSSEKRAQIKETAFDQALKLICLAQVAPFDPSLARADYSGRLH